MGRSHQSLQRIKALTGGSFTSSPSGLPGGSDGLIIAQLSHELASLHKENKAVRTSYSSLSRDLMNGADGYEGEPRDSTRPPVASSEEIEDLKSKLEVSKLAGQREAAR